MKGEATEESFGETSSSASGCSCGVPFLRSVASYHLLNVVVVCPQGSRIDDWIGLDWIGDDRRRTASKTKNVKMMYSGEEILMGKSRTADFSNESIFAAL